MRESSHPSGAGRSSANVMVVTVKSFDRRKGKHLLEMLVLRGHGPRVGISFWLDLRTAQFFPCTEQLVDAFGTLPVEALQALPEQRLFAAAAQPPPAGQTILLDDEEEEAGIGGSKGTQTRPTPALAAAARPDPVLAPAAEALTALSTTLRPAPYVSSRPTLTIPYVL